jgi:putative lumazine-binding protein
MSTSATAVSASSEYIRDYDAIVDVMNRYNEGVRTGSSSVMKPVFHQGCTFYGYYQGSLLAGPIQMLFDWVDGNGPAADIQTRIANVDIRESIASVRIEMENMTGKMAGSSPSRLTDLFQLVRIDGNWMISQKSFHWY